MSKPLNDQEKNKVSKDSMTTNEQPRGAFNTCHQLFRDYVDELERKADIQCRQNDLNDCAEFVSQLVDLFKHTIIMPELQSKNDSDDDNGHQFKQNKAMNDTSLLNENMEEIAVSKGLTQEQWKALLYFNLTAGDSLEMITVTRGHLKKVRDMTTRLLEDEEQIHVLALIDAIEKHMPERYFIEK